MQSNKEINKKKKKKMLLTDKSEKEKTGFKKIYRLISRAAVVLELLLINPVFWIR